ncbi:MAG TPA: VOC family protein [Nocardioides sp.]|nr:VOC family protein [Nocardioides sp.]
MSIDLNHTIVHVRDRNAAAREVADTLGLGEPTAYGPFAVVEMANGVSLDFMEDSGEIQGQHYAFLVSDDDFDRIHQKLRDDGRQWWADPFRRTPGEINTNDGGRGLYWEGPDGHWLEIITVPYGGG